MKTEAELRNLIKKGESIQLEFKRSVALDSIRSTVLAFANDYAEVGGGTIIIGVEKAGEPVGISGDLDALQQRLASAAREAEPPLAPTIYVQSIQGRSVVIIEVLRGLRRPYLAKGNCYIRVGSTTRMATFDEMLELRSRYEVPPGQTRHIIHSLPPRESIVVRFIGRRKELDSLQQWIQDPDARRWALAGAGGKGKTAIAYQFACAIRDMAYEPLEMAIWMSAKKRKFEEGAIVAIENPDFHDLESALDKILCDYGYVDMMGADIAAKKEEVLQLLAHLPALIVVDDVDTLDARDQNAIDFLMRAAEKTHSRLLVTSRKELYPWGNITTLVEGFDETEGAEFIQSRVELFRLDPDLFKKKRVRAILRVTEGSPLYIEDLLRLSIIEPLDAAIKRWIEDPGDKAREFAFGRELDELSSEAKEVLLACSLNEGPISIAEVEAITGFDHNKVASTIRELHRLFLLPMPRYIEGIERFDVNANTRLLIKKIMAGSRTYIRTIAALNSLSGGQEFSLTHRRKIRGYANQAITLAKEGRREEAEATIEEGLRQHPNDPELLGQLGWLYKSWEPRRRLTDARKRFRRSDQLKCTNESMYWHWVDMECSEKEWTKASEAAEKGLERLPQSVSLRYIAGRAFTLLGMELADEMQWGRAHQELIKAKRHFDKLLSPTYDEMALMEGHLRGYIYEHVVLILETLVRCEQNQVWVSTRERNKAIVSLLRELKMYLERWSREFPEDTRYVSRRDRLFSRFPELGSL